MNSMACLFALLCLVTPFSGSFAWVDRSIECTNPAPNLNKISLGVDISSLDLLPIDFTSQSSYKKPVVSFTCNQGRIWKRHGKDYQLPDQVSILHNIPGGWFTASVNTYKSASDVRKNMNIQVGLKGSFKGFSFSGSSSYAKIKSSVKNSERYISDTSSYHSPYKAELYNSYILSLNPAAQVYLDKIGDKTYKNNPDAYHGFIDLYGTHYFSSAQFGGQIRVLFSTSRKYAKSHSEQNIQANAKASFLKFFSASGNFDLANKSVDSDFTKESSNTIRYYGGSTNLVSSTGLAAWQTTVEADPWLITGKLKPISDLIKDDNHRSGVQQAALQHVMRNYLKELRHQIQSVRVKMGYSVTIEDLDDRLTALEGVPLGKLVKEDVDALSKDINNMLTVPSWFLDRTRMCMKWRPDGDAGQCGGGKPTLCALPGEMTPYYRDDTDERHGGCVMKWSIQSRGFDTWFQNVQVCYRWYADGSSAAECSGIRKKTVCAPVNEYTPFYRDDSDHRAGGCQMSWRLLVPDSAPLWLQTTKLCYRWYPDGDHGQCGARSRHMCAIANEWTPYYRDDTDKRHGGCQMSWGLHLGF